MLSVHQMVGSEILLLGRPRKDICMGARCHTLGGTAAVTLLCAVQHNLLLRWRRSFALLTVCTPHLFSTPRRNMHSSSLSRHQVEELLDSSDDDAFIPPPPPFSAPSRAFSSPSPPPVSPSAPSASAPSSEAALSRQPAPAGDPSDP